MGIANGGHSHIALFILGAISLLALVYPYIIYPRILRFFPKKPYGPIENENYDPDVALLFCAYNEEASSRSKVENIRELKKRYPSLEVYAYTDCCSDGTLEVLRSASDVITVYEGLTRVGKASGMRELVGATESEILVFTDANVTVDPDSISRIISYFANPDIGTVAGTLHYTNPDDGDAAQISSLYWRLEEFIKRCESETGSTTGADGSIFAIRRSLYPEVPPDLLDDMIASINPIFHGYRVVSATDVLAFEKAPAESRDEFRRKRRIACRAFGTHRYLAPQLRSMSNLNKFKYVSHKYMRWFSALFLILSLLLWLAGLAALFDWKTSAIVLVSGIVMLAIGHKLRFPVIGGIAEITLNILAVGIGVVEAMFGRKFQVWNPAKSRN